jgi:hypothetical protein
MLPVGPKVIAPTILDFIMLLPCKLSTYTSAYPPKGILQFLSAIGYSPVNMDCGEKALDIPSFGAKILYLHCGEKTAC